MDWNLNDLYGNIKSKKILNDFSKLDKKALRFNNNFKNKINNKIYPNRLY